MSLPKYFPDPQKTQKLIDDLLGRVKSLDPVAKKRLTLLLDNEADLPMLDKVERRYREKVIKSLDHMTDRKSAADLASALRSHFVRNLNLQRAYLHECVRKALHNEETGENNALHTPPEFE